MIEIFMKFMYARKEADKWAGGKCKLISEFEKHYPFKKEKLQSMKNILSESEQNWYRQNITSNYKSSANSYDGY